jgi:5-methylcytosine-specific restriction endonuclease McrA
VARRKSTNPLKHTNWSNWKATQVRSSWRERAKKFGLNLNDVPTRAEIQDWLEAQSPIKCYIEGTFISTEVMELDHKTPLSRGGKLHLENVGCTSRYYNNIKGTMTEKEFRQLLRLVKKWDDKGESIFKRLMASNHMFSRRRR